MLYDHNLVNVLSLISLCGIRKTRTFENQNHFKFSSSVYTLSKWSSEGSLRTLVRKSSNIDFFSETFTTLR